MEARGEQASTFPLAGLSGAHGGGESARLLKRILPLGGFQETQSSHAPRLARVGPGGPCLLGGIGVGGKVWEVPGQ